MHESLALGSLGFLRPEILGGEARGFNRCSVSLPAGPASVVGWLVGSEKGSGDALRLASKAAASRPEYESCDVKSLNSSE